MTAITSTANRRMTKRDYFTALKTFAEVGEFKFPISQRIGTSEDFETVYVDISPAEMAEFAKHELELLDRKNTVDKKPTATQVANEGIKADIKAFLDAHKGEKFTVSALMKSIPAIAEASNQKVSSLVRQMVLDGQADRIEDKRKAYFTAK